MAICRICNGEAKPHFETKVLNRYHAAYRYCGNCDYIFADSPYWLEEAYSDAIVKTDTDIATRNLLTSLRLAAILYFAFEDRGRGTYVDVAGGYGLLTRFMRDLGFDFYWSDPHATNLFARGFEYSPSNGNCAAISAIEVLEHTVNPLEFLHSNLSTHGADTILLTTQLFPAGRPPDAGEWSYFSLETGQHISFFSSEGLRKLGQRLGLTYHPLGRLHLLTRKRLPKIRIRIASDRLFALPLALLAARSLGSKRGADQAKMVKLARAAEIA